MAKQIKQAEKNLMFSDDARTRKSLDVAITELRDDLEALERQLTEIAPVLNEDDEDHTELLTTGTTNSTPRPLKYPSLRTAQATSECWTWTLAK